LFTSQDLSKSKKAEEELEKNNAKMEIANEKPHVAGG
jgi:hypothetical protein